MAAAAALCWGCVLPLAPAARAATAIDVVDTDMLMAPAAGPASVPMDELERLSYIGRAQPDVATASLLRYAGTLRIDDPRYLEALLEVGSEYVALHRAEQVEQTAARIEALSDRLPLARPAAMLLRGQWMQIHGELSKAERQIIEASALLPPHPPDFLRLRVLMSSAYVKRRGGHFDEAMANYNQALKLVDATGPTWRRVDLRAAAAIVLQEAGEPDKAAEVAREEMRLATDSSDEFGISAAYTVRAILASANADDRTVLDLWRAALEHARLGGSRRQAVMGMANMADYYLVHDDFQTAWELSHNALPLSVQINDPAVQSVALANTGLSLIGLRRKDEGMPLVRESMRIDESSGSASSLADTARELGRALEQAGYKDEALAAYHQYRQMADELNQQDRQRALIELQEGFANENRQHELDMLGREGRLKDEKILHHALEVRLWSAAALAGLLLLAVIAVLARRLRVRNRLLAATNEQLRLQAETDPLTGVSNRRHLQATMAERPALEGTLYLLDVDHFKRINDRCGHAGGDAVLVEIARRLQQALRGDDVIVRWGGEEFLVLVRPLPQAEAEALAQRLLCALADTPVTHAGQTVPVSASIGFGRFPMPASTPAQTLDVSWERAISLVDTAMYLAKSRGRNGACSVRRVDASEPALVEQIVAQLERSAREGRVELHFQQGPGVRSAKAA